SEGIDRGDRILSGVVGMEREGIAENEILLGESQPLANGPTGFRGTPGNRIAIDRVRDDANRAGEFRHLSRECLGHEWRGHPDCIATARAVAPAVWQHRELP